MHYGKWRDKMKREFKIGVGIMGIGVAIATGIYASWKINQKYRDDRNFREEINAIPYEIKK